ncbi:uncharacterized protein CEXT_102841 [Caerostris extrusa]|uniref:Uncharacterized protein n=1 Tax=Caerostris extrusa TaxID=172846 RepID=A0AAV4QEG0_CAEEX|nr:uncharacterized protein CEXT_102841 [Caerostris extrusa]
MTVEDLNFWWLFFTCFVIPSAFFVQTVEICSDKNLLNTYVKGELFGWSSDEKWVNCAALTCLDLIVLNQKYTFPGFTIVLCCYIFGILRRILESFDTNIEEKNDFQMIFNFYLKNSKKIQTCVQQVEDSFSLLLFFVYGYMFCSIFNVSTLLIRVNPKNTPDMSLMIPHYISIVLVLGAFYITSFRATAVHETGVKIKDRVHAIVAVSDSADPEQKCLLLSAVAEFPSKIIITGWNLFKLNGHFTHRTAGIIITYSILLSQLDQ